jgi:integrase
VRRAFRLATAEDKYHGRVPKFPMLQERNTRTGFFEDAMIEAVRAKLAPSLQPVVTFAYITGWRVQSEVLPLEWRQVDRKAGEVRLDPFKTKNQAGRVFPLHRCAPFAADRLVGRTRGVSEGGHDLPVRVPSPRPADQVVQESLGDGVRRRRVSGAHPA